MDNDHMDIGGGMVPIMEGKYFLEKATGRIFKMNIDTGSLEEVEAPDDLRLLDNGEEDDHGRD